MKEAGKFDQSLEVYQKASNISDDDSDLHLQMGHLYKLMKRDNDSMREYQKSFNLDPNNICAQEEIEKSGGLAIVRKSEHLNEESKDIHTIWLDVTDFVVYVQHNQSLSGIQRVIANLALYLKKQISQVIGLFL